MYWCDWDEGVVSVAVYILDVKDRQQFYRCQVEYNVPACSRPGGSQAEPCVHTLKSDLPLCLMGCSVVHINMLEPLELASQYGEIHSCRMVVHLHLRALSREWSIGG